MRDAKDEVLYVGKAKNLRKRLASYRVANPDRKPRRHLRLLRAVARVELQECPDESAALTRESELLRGLRPRFNRVGTCPGPPRFVGWRVTEQGLDLAVRGAIEAGWHGQGPFGASAIGLRASLVRLLWCALQPERGLAGMPEGWFCGRFMEQTTIPWQQTGQVDVEAPGAGLRALFAGCPDDFAAWIRERTSMQSHPFELAVREADLETVSGFANHERLADTQVL